MDPNSVVLTWGVVVSLILSGLKRLGLSDAYVPVANVVLSGVGSVVYNLMHAMPLVQALSAGLATIFASHLTFAAVTKPASAMTAGK